MAALPSLLLVLVLHGQTALIKGEDSDTHFQVRSSGSLLDSVKLLAKEAEQKLSGKLRDESKFLQKYRKTRNLNRPFGKVQSVLRTSKEAKKISLPQMIIESCLVSTVDKFKNKIPVPSILAQLKGKFLASIGLRGGPISDCPFKLNTPCNAIATVDRYRTFDGSCNNRKNPLYGKAFTPLKRDVPPAYDDGVCSPRGPSLPSPRKVVQVVHFEKLVPSDVASLLFVFWGQFIDHEFALTALSQFNNTETGKPEDIVCGTDGCDTTVDACFPIPVDPATDTFYDTKTCLEFVRSQAVPNIDCTLGPREQLNEITAFIDASNVYGSTKEEADNLRQRIPYHGKMILGAKLKHQINSKDSSLMPLLPREDSTNNFLAGDERVNENTLLTSLHTLWMREHNRLVDALMKLNPWMSAETLYQEARRIVGAMHQHIHYNEYLPVLLGPETINKYNLKLKTCGYADVYDESVDASVMNGFATAAFRFGHSLIPGEIPLFDENNKQSSSLKLNQLVLAPELLTDNRIGGVDAFLRSLLQSASEDFDRFFTTQISGTLFAETKPKIGTDLPSLNIQRGRDHGIPDYNEWRKWCGFRPVYNFDQLGLLLKNPWLARAYKCLYRGDINALDLFSVGVAEPTVTGGTVGETFACIIARQFQRFREGDRFWYEGNVKDTRSFTRWQLKQIRKVTLAKVICNNSDDIKTVPERPLLIRGGNNPVKKCSDIKDMDLRYGWRFRKW